jgi:transposase
MSPNPASVPFVIGVDTHARTHTYAVLAANGEHVDTATFPNTKPGRARAIAWASRRTGGDLDTLWVVEGTGNYGALLAGTVARDGYEVIEAPRVTAYASARSRAGKSDPLDAAAIAAASLPLEHTKLRIPRHDQRAQASLRVLLAAREQMTDERTAKVNALVALTRSVDLEIDTRQTLTPEQMTTVAHWRTRNEDLAVSTARTEATRLAKRITALDGELRDNHTRMTEILESTPAAGLLDETGVGPVNAAVVYTAWSHLGRVHSEAAFAALAGVNPIPASSGNTVRHRLNRGGDRRLNSALHMAVVARMAHDPATRAYADRRTAEGKTPREIRRCLKRYLARHLYRSLNALHTSTENGH